MNNKASKENSDRRDDNFLGIFNTNSMKSRGKCNVTVVYGVC